jgi:hypothetical protein
MKLPARWGGWKASEHDPVIRDKIPDSHRGQRQAAITTFAPVEIRNYLLARIDHRFPIHRPISDTRRTNSVMQLASGLDCRRQGEEWSPKSRGAPKPVSSLSNDATRLNPSDSARPGGRRAATCPVLERRSFRGLRATSGSARSPPRSRVGATLRPSRSLPAGGDARGLCSPNSRRPVGGGDAAGERSPRSPANFKIWH